MRLHFQEKPWDLFVVVGYTLAMTAILLLLNKGEPAAVLLVFFVPGYVLVAALFPHGGKTAKGDVDWAVRIALSLALSIAVVPSLALLLDQTPWGIGFLPIVATITIFTMGMSGAAYWRRMRLPPMSRLSLTIDLGKVELTGKGMLDKGLNAALALSIVIAGGSITYSLLSAQQTERFTEFAILGPGRNVSSYPTALNVNDTGTVMIQVVNHEATTVRYTVQVDLIGVRIVSNATSGMPDIVESNRTTWTRWDITLEAEASWTYLYSFSIAFIGLWKLQFLLFKESDLSSPYRELHLFVTVT